MAGIPIHRRYADEGESSHSRFETDEDDLPAGGGGGPRDSNLFVTDAPYSQLYDYLGGNAIYMGQCVPGQSLNTALPVWRIRRFEYDGAGNVVAVRWAEGTARKNKVWDDRAAYTYK